jgi:putative ABC transport system permease protein
LRVSDLARFAAGALRGHRLRTSLSLLGVAIGVTAVILLTSLGQGARLYVVGEFASLGTNLVIVVPGKTETTGMAPIVGGAPNDLTLEDAEAIARRCRAVRRVAPLAAGAADARFGERSRNVTVVGATPEMAAVRKMRIQIGRYLPGEEIGRGQRVCVIGPTVQRELFGNSNPLGEMLRLGDERYRVIGVLASRGVSLGQDFDDMVQIPASRAMKMFNQSSLFRILVEVNSGEEIDTARRQILGVLRDRHDGVEDVTVLTQDAVIATFGNILSLLTLVLGGIAAISLSVAGIGIMNVMLVSVSERRREIGLLKAVGVSARQIVALFVTESAILSTAGGLAGLLAGSAGVGVLRALFPGFPVEPPVWAVASALGASLVLGVVFGALPASRASRLDPVAALARK